MLSTLGNQSFEGVIFQNQQGEFLRSFSVKNNPINQVDITGIHADSTLTRDEQESNVEISEQSINVLQGGTMNHINRIVEEIRILIDEETIEMDFTTTLPAANKIVISYSSRQFTTRLMEITLGMTGQAAISLLAYATTTAATSSSKSLRGLNFVVAANAVGFIATFLGMWFSKKNKQKKQVAAASVIAGKIGGIAAACAIIVAMGMFLPDNVISMWFIGFVCLFPAAVVLFA